jgi:hypothetical protein
MATGGMALAVDAVMVVYYYILTCSHDQHFLTLLSFPVLMTDNLLKIPLLVRHAKRAMRVINQCIGLAVASKVIVLSCVFAGLVPLWLSVVLDTVTLLIVTGVGTQMLTLRFSDDDLLADVDTTMANAKPMTYSRSATTTSKKAITYSRSASGGNGGVGNGSGGVGVATVAPLYFKPSGM